MDTLSVQYSYDPGFAIYKIYDMVCFDYFLLLKFKFFQHYYPETERTLAGRKYGFNIKSQLFGNTGYKLRWQPDM